MTGERGEYMKTLLIKNANNIITMNKTRDQFPGGSMYIEGQEIKAIGYDLPYESGDVVIDARGKNIYPGLINTHHHLYQTFTRNIPWIQNTELFGWLVPLYDIWRHLRPEDVYLSAIVGLGELLKSGCTTTSDHFYVFPNGVSGELIDEEINAAMQLGIRFYPTRGSMSLGRSKGGLPPDEVVQTEYEIIRDTVRVIESYHDPSKFSMLRVGVAPCSPFSVSPDLLKESAKLARSYRVRMHTHLAETRDEEDFCKEKLGMRPLELMEETGWVGKDVWYAHGIWFNDEEIIKLGQCGCGVAHCPSSNMKMASGTMPIMDMLKAGVKVGFGVDGSASNDSSNILLDLKIMNLLHNLQHGTTALSAEDCLSIATSGSAKVLGWDDAIGSLEAGKAADMFMIDVNRLEFSGARFDDASLPILAGTPKVDTTIVGGKVVVDKGRLVHIDERKLAIQAQQAATRMLETASKYTKIDYKKSRVQNSSMFAGI
jgi:cytosine/adenosine deaminase-related metal-dependent hydrolase